MNSDIEKKLWSAADELRANSSKLLVYVSKLNYAIDDNDIHIIGSMLESVGESDNIDLLIQSGGGIGTVAEKIVEMIRSYCRKEFRVIVPILPKALQR